MLCTFPPVSWLFCLSVIYSFIHTWDYFYFPAGSNYCVLLSLRQIPKSHITECWHTHNKYNQELSLSSPGWQNRPKQSYFSSLFLTINLIFFFCLHSDVHKISATAYDSDTYNSHIPILRVKEHTVRGTMDMYADSSLFSYWNKCFLSL